MSDKERPLEKYIIEGWLLVKGTAAEYFDNVSYIKAPRGKGRAEAFKILIEAFKKAGYTEDEIRTEEGVIESELKKQCILPKHRAEGYGREIRKWENSILDEWRRQIKNIFSEQHKTHTEEAEKKFPKKTVEQKPKENLPPIESRPILDGSGGDETPVATVSEIDEDFLTFITVKK